MRIVKSVFALFMFSLVLFSCGKESVTKNRVLQITPEKVVSYEGKDWTSISSEFSSRQNYLYSKLNNGNILAAVSLPAKDHGAPAENFKLLFNINQENRVTAVILTSVDPIDVKTGNKLLLYYYEKALSPMDGVFYTFAIDSYDHQVNIGVEALLEELRTSNCAEASLDYRNSEMAVTAGYSSGTFSFNIFAP